jgi:choline dehydrogenase-like flavoprotein
MSKSSLPQHGIVRGRTLEGDIDLSCDAVVIGTGAGGSIAARALARAGVETIALEEGGWHRPQDFDQREENMLPMLFQDAGGRSTEDLAIRVLQGRGIGGSTIHNTNLCKRTPDAILDLWEKKYDVKGATSRDLLPAFETIERDLSVAPIPSELVNRNNDVLRRGVAALGWKGGVLAQNRIGCQQSGFCELGCAYDAKQNASKVVIPQALDAGARVFADVRVDRVLTEAGRVTGVRARALDANGTEIADVRVRAKVVVLAASAVGSAHLARRSALTDPRERTGLGLRMHPGAVVAGLFDEEIAGHRGIPQSYECTEMLDFAEGSDKRVWIVPAFAHPIGTAAMMPGFGADHMRAMREYKRIAVLTAMLHDETSGEVMPGEDGPILRYKMIEADRAALARGLVACAKLLFAAGAKRVSFPAIPPVTVESASALDKLDTSFVVPSNVPLSAVHPMGTMRMGEDKRRCVVDSTGEHHHVKGLFVMDGSLFPTSLGGPPQISIYAFAEHLAPHAIARAKRG